MKAAFYIYTLLLLLCGMLAWTLTAEGFLLVASFSGLVVYAMLYRSSRPVAEGARLLTAAALTIAGPLQYQRILTPLLLCFISIPLYLAATQALAEQREGAEGHGHPRMRSLVFTIAFYTVMGLVFLLARGVEPALTRTTSTWLAAAVLLLAIPAWDFSRIHRLRRAGSTGGAGWSRWLLPVSLLILLGLAFAGPLPMAAGLLTRISPHWRIDPYEFKNKPPHPPVTGKEARPVNAEATRPGTEESSATGTHKLPPSSDLQLTDQPLFFVRLETPDAAAALVKTGPAYLRSHTLNRFSENQWTAEISGGVWFSDEEDGTTDGRVVLQPGIAPEAVILHEVFCLVADGYTLPALAGLTAIHLPRVYAIPGDVLQAQVAGATRYRAESLPRNYPLLSQRGLLRPAQPEDKVHRRLPEGELANQLHKLALTIFRGAEGPDARIQALRGWMAQNLQYSTVMQNSKNFGAIENFLFDEKKGHCDFYATAAALLLREAGLPTRIAYGHATTELAADQQTLIFRDHHSHAWTEVNFLNIGWTICDFTPAPDIGQAAQNARNPPPPVPAPETNRFTDAAKEVPIPALKKTGIPTDYWKSLQSWMQQQTWVGSLFRNLTPVLAIPAVLLLLWQLYQRRRKKIAAAAGDLAVTEPQPEYYLEFLRASATAGHPKSAAATPMEHFHRMEQAGLPVPPLLPLLTYHCATRYEDAPREPSREKEFHPEISRFAAATAPQPSGPRS